MASSLFLSCPPGLRTHSFSRSSALKGRRGGEYTEGGEKKKVYLACASYSSKMYRQARVNGERECFLQKNRRVHSRVSLLDPLAGKRRKKNLLSHHREREGGRQLQVQSSLSLSSPSHSLRSSPASSPLSCSPCYSSALLSCALSPLRLAHWTRSCRELPPCSPIESFSRMKRGETFRHPSFSSLSYTTLCHSSFSYRGRLHTRSSSLSIKNLSSSSSSSLRGTVSFPLPSSSFSLHQPSSSSSPCWSSSPAVSSAPPFFFSSASPPSLSSSLPLSSSLSESDTLVRNLRKCTTSLQPPLCHGGPLSQASVSSQVMERRGEERQAEREREQEKGQCYLPLSHKKDLHSLCFFRAFSLLSSSPLLPSRVLARKLQKFYGRAHGGRSSPKESVASSTSSSLFSSVPNLPFSCSLLRHSPSSGSSKRFFSSGFPNTKRRKLR